MHRAFVPLALAMLLGAGGWPARVEAQTDPAGRAKELAEARAAVERLEAEIRAARDQEQRALSTLSAQRDEIAVLLRRERIRVDELRSRLADIEATRAAADAGGGDLRSTVLRVADRLIAVVEKSLPFRIEDRLAALRGVRDDVSGGRLSPENGASRLWQFVEDEIRLASDVGRYRDAVAIDGTRELVEMAKVGMLALYVRTADGRLAYAVEGDAGFTFERIESPAQVRAVQKLFDALVRQVRTGAHEVPLGRIVEDAR